MKLIIFFIGLLLPISILATSTGITVPDAAKKTFKNKFPSATNVKWGKENAHEYEAEFKLGGKNISANFSENGQWLETETQLDLNALPQKVRDAFNSRYSNANVKEAARIESSNKVIYEVEFKQGTKTIEIKYTEQGVETK